MPHVQLANGADIHYVTAGSGARSLLLVHGNLGSAAWWEPTLAALPAAFTAYAIDLPGSGKSPETGQRHTMEYFARVVRDFAAAIGVERAAIVGHSMGGGVAQNVTLQQPTLVERLVLLDSMAADGFHVLFEQGPSFLERLMRDRAFLARALRAVMPRCRDEALIQRLVASSARASEQVFLEQPITMHEANWFARLGEIRCPTLFLHGELDDFVPKAGSERTAAAIADCTLEWLAECGHSPQVEVPEVFHAKLFAFLG